MHVLNAIIRRELRLVLRETTILIAIVIQLFIASFSSALLIGLLSLYDPDSAGMFAQVKIGVAFVGANNHPLITQLQERGIRVNYFTAPTDAERAFRENRVDAILVAPADTGEMVSLKLFLPPVEARASAILAILREPLKRYEDTLRGARGIEVRYTDLKGTPATTFEFLYSVLVPVLMFFPAFVAGSLVVDSLSEELENNTLETLLSAPVSLNIVASGKIIAALIIAALQLVAWIGLLGLNGIVVQNVVLVVSLALVIAALIAVMSAFVVLAFHDRERSQFVYSLFVLLAASVSYIFDLSPIKVITRLAIGDAFTGVFDVLKYVLVLVIAFVVFWEGLKRVARA